MAESKNLARVILRSDGSVHIAFYDVHSIYATAENIMKFFSDPIEFIENESQKYEDSTHLINRKRVDLDNVLGLTLASVNNDKQIVCDFPELFQYIMQNSDAKESKKHFISSNLSQNSHPLDALDLYVLHGFLSESLPFRRQAPLPAHSGRIFLMWPTKR